MVIQVKLYSMLRLKYKGYEIDKGINFSAEKSLCIMDLLKLIDINPKDVSVVFVNDTQIKVYSQLLSDGDIVKIFPPFPAGG